MPVNCTHGGSESVWNALTGDEQRLMQAENARLKRELARISEEQRIPKKSGGVFCEGVQVKYATIRKHELAYAVCLMCRAFKVSRSGYYHWRGRAPSLRAQSREQLDGRVRKAFQAEKARIGSPRVTRRLQAQRVYRWP